MTKELFVSSTPHETKVGMVEEDQLAEIYLERENEYTLAGSIYKGRVTRVLPGMQSAFVDIGLERDAFLYVSDFMELSEHDDDLDEVIPAPRQFQDHQVREHTFKQPELEGGAAAAAPAMAVEPEARLEGQDPTSGMASITEVSPVGGVVQSSEQDQDKDQRGDGGVAVAAAAGAVGTCLSPVLRGLRKAQILVAVRKPAAPKVALIRAEVRNTAHLRDTNPSFSLASPFPNTNVCSSRPGRLVGVPVRLSIPMYRPGSQEVFPKMSLCLPRTRPNLCTSNTIHIWQWNHSSRSLSSTHMSVSKNAWNV